MPASTAAPTSRLKVRSDGEYRDKPGMTMLLILPRRPLPPPRCCCLAAPCPPTIPS